MEVRIPATFKEIPLGAFMAWHKAKTDSQRVMAITGISDADVRKLTVESIRTVAEKISTVLELETASLVHIVEGKDKQKYGLIPDFTSMTYGEHVDLDGCAQAIWADEKKPDYSQLPDLMAILYRPVINEIGEHYEIAEYNSDKVYHLDAIKRMSMENVRGALLFFSTIRKELVKNSLRYLDQSLMNSIQKVRKAIQEELQEIALQTNGDGITSYNSAQEMTSQKMTP